MKKSPLLYISIIFVWLGLLTATMTPLWMAIHQSELHGKLVLALVTMSTLFIGYFWLNGIKDVVYTLYYYVRKRSMTDAPPINAWPKTYGIKNPPLVAMVYCTYNDFNAESLLASMRQDYPNHKVVILDDSSQEEYKREIDEFAERYNVEVVRRPDHVGFKAGNLNNYLRTAQYDFFVILDSDEIVPENFITRCLDYFAHYKNVGIVQANHKASRNRNRFMNLFSIGVNSHWPTYQAVKHHHGFLSLLGHGAMVSRECYDAAGGFPHLVAEDLCFSIESRNKGYYVGFAADVMCEEEYPIDYLAFKKRHSKWTQGNMEFIKKYTWRILRSKMSWYEKLDIVLFTYSLPLTAFFALYVVINVVLLPLLHYKIVYPVWLLVPTGIFLLAPMLNDIIFYARKKHPMHLGWYLIHSLLLYGSMFFISLKSSIKSTFGHSVFLVTPKDANNVSFWEAIKANRGELVFAVGLCTISYLCDKSPLPTILIVIPSVLTVYLSLMANQPERGRPERDLQLDR
ncbi:MAG TPA: glycosyltransferase family 2 protein [Candidatus Saccharimonadales bacterium]|jgi:cellulose synthase/poly-beta-1,6-N-acetylglucosamine synthase-like glycosyltransferase|nr:glycosyltransferase family 2 protein [Candidatus Saccharimonadales bacterium]